MLYARQVEIIGIVETKETIERMNEIKYELGDKWEINTILEARGNGRDLFWLGWRRTM